MNIKREKIEKLIILYEKYRASSQEMEAQLKAKGKGQLDFAILDLNNPDRDNIFDFINSLSQIEKDTITALMKFGQIYYESSKEDYKFCVNNSRFVGEYDIDYMIARPLSKYLRNGLMKLDLLNQNN